MRARAPRAHRDADEQASALDLAHMLDLGIVRLEAPQDLPGLADDANRSVPRSEEQAVGARADARDIAALKDLFRIVVGSDLGDFEEVK